MPILVVVPHFDDAVFSVAESMLGWIEDDGYDVIVLTVFGAVTNGKETTLEREHHAAMTMLGAVDYINLPFADDAHGPDAAGRRDLRAAVDTAVHDTHCGVSVWPFGIHHPDHVLTALMGAGRRPKWIYFELPYYVLYPEQVGDPEKEWGWTRMWSRNYLEDKRELVACYASAVDENLERSLYAPERVFKARERRRPGG